MATFEDTFTEESNVNLSAHTPTGPNAGTGWTTIEDTGSKRFEVRSQDDYTQPSGNHSANRNLLTMQPNPTDTEYDVTFTFVNISISANSPIFLLGRLTDLSNYYSGGGYRNADNPDAQLYKKVGGVVTNLASGDTNWTATDTCTLKIRDATKKLFKNTTEILSSTDNALTAAGQAGLGCGNAWIGTDDIHGGWGVDNYIVVEVTGGGGTLLRHPGMAGGMNRPMLAGGMNG